MVENDELVSSIIVLSIPTLWHCKAPSTPATMSKQHRRMLQVERFFRQSRMLLRHCCWCGRGLIAVAAMWVGMRNGYEWLKARWINLSASGVGRRCERSRGIHDRRREKRENGEKSPTLGLWVICSRLSRARFIFCASIESTTKYAKYL